MNAGEYYAFEDDTVATDDDDDSGNGVEDPDFTNGNASTYNFDGGDRIYVTGGPVFVLRAALPHDFMSVCWELLPVAAWRTDVILPFGIDLYAADNTVFHDFMRVGVVIQSAADANTVTVDCPVNANDWSGDLDRGETKFFTDIRKGTTISCDTEVQVHMIIGSSLNYDIRGISGIPAFDGNGNDYWAPIEVSTDTDMFIYNHNAGSITVNYEDGTTGSFTVAAGETVSYHNETSRWVTSGAHVYTSGDEFCAVLSIDTNAGTYDWASGLTQASNLGTDYRIGWAPGGSYNPNTAINNCIFAIATEDDTDIFVDIDADGDIDQYFTAGNSLNKLDVVLIADELDHDTSGARIWTNDKKIALSYGEISGTNPFEGGTTPSGSPAMDLGYTILPMPDAWVEPVIEVTASDDQGETPVAVIGEAVEFTVRLDAHDYDLTNVDLSANLDICWEFVDNSTTINHYNSGGTSIWSTSGDTADPVISGNPNSGYLLTWDISRDVDNNEWIILTFEAYPTACSLEGENETVSRTEGTYDSHQFNAYDSEFVTLDGPPGEFGDEPVPVMLSSFTAEFDDIPIIYWETQSEMQNLGWNIYRSDDEDGFETGDYIQINNGLIPASGTTSEPTYYMYEDEEETASEFTYWYSLESISYSGNTENYGPVSLTTPLETGSEIPPVVIGLHNNYPNPFNPTTSITFAVKEETNATLTVINVKGQKVKTLLNRYIPENEIRKEITSVWNGTDSNDKKAASGIYFYKLEAENKTIIKKMILMK